jgi:hypothetical protein
MYISWKKRGSFFFEENEEYKGNKEKKTNKQKRLIFELPDNMIFSSTGLTPCIDFKHYTNFL